MTIDNATKDAILRLFPDVTIFRSCDLVLLGTRVLVYPPADEWHLDRDYRIVDVEIRGQTAYVMEVQL